MTVAYILAFAAAAASQPNDLSVQAVHNFGACVVRYTPQGAERVLAMDYRTEAYREALRRLARGHDRCVTPAAQLKSGGVLLAGAMAEALVEAEVKDGDLPKRLAFDPQRPAIEARGLTEAMALCTALHEPRGTAALFKTEPGSRGEEEAVEAPNPALTECLSKNVKLTVNKPALRSLLALAAWRIVSTSGNPAT
jgi:hypothetical protein